jgi:uncharacterized protein YjiS (DUF1127 family)
LAHARDALRATFRRGGARALARATSPSYYGTRRTARSWLLWLVHWCALAAAPNHQHQALAELDDRLLRDIGKTRLEIEIEAAKPFWWK